MQNYQWYRELAKPRWAPPAWLFGPVWTVLYIIIAISFGTVFYHFLYSALPFAIALPFLLNLVLNALFTPIQFRLRNNFLALIDIILVWLTLVFSLYAIYFVPAYSGDSFVTVFFPNLRWVALVNIPYLVWVSFATVLQASITWRNRQK